MSKLSFGTIHYWRHIWLLNHQLDKSAHCTFRRIWNLTGNYLFTSILLHNKFGVQVLTTTVSLCSEAYKQFFRSKLGNKGQGRTCFQNFTVILHDDADTNTIRRTRPPRLHHSMKMILVARPWIARIYYICFLLFHR